MKHLNSSSILDLISSSYCWINILPTPHRCITLTEGKTNHGYESKKKNPKDEANLGRDSEIVESYGLDYLGDVKLRYMNFIKNLNTLKTGTHIYHVYATGICLYNDVSK